MLNVYAHVSTDPQVLRYRESVGRDNDAIISEYLSKHNDVLCAWSNCGRHRQNELARMIDKKEVYCLGVDRRGYPLHPSRKSDGLIKRKMYFIGNRKGNLLAVM